MNMNPPQDVARLDASGRPLILIVDDVPANLHLLSAELRAQYRIKVAREGQSALNIVRHSADPPDLVLLDVMMPGMSGHDVLREMRSDPATADIPVILVTADTSEGGELRGLGLGACDFLNKPVDVPVMRARVNNLVAQRLMQREILRSRLKLQAMLDSSMQFIALLDLDGQVLHMNRPVREVMGLGAEVLPTQAFWELRPWQDHLELATRLQQAMLQASQGEASRFESALRLADGSAAIVDISLGPVRGSHGETAYVLFEARDITSQRRAEESVQVLVYRDGLTGLPNRNELARRVQHALQASPGAPLALLRVELSRLAEVNEAYGQQACDEAICVMAGRLVDGVRLSDTVARLEGGSFALLLPGADASGAAAVARKLAERLNLPCRVQDFELQLSARLGVALAPTDASDFCSLLNCADVAVSLSGSFAAGPIRFFSVDMQQGLTRRLQMESLLRQAVAQQELQLFYQPQVHLATGACLGVEALLRWHSAELGPVSPLEFIGLAEANGLIHGLGQWVLQEAIAQIGRWRDAGVPVPSVAINLSAVQLQHPGIVDMLLAALDAAGLPARYLEIELTETAAFQDPQLALGRIEAMRRGGLRIAIDDFGTGFSSLSYLQRIHVDVLKIDRSFVQHLGEGGEDEALMESMLAMARALNIPVLAEGVETGQQAAWLRSKGCHAAQGYHFGRPMPAPALAAWWAARGAGLPGPA